MIRYLGLILAFMMALILTGCGGGGGSSGPNPNMDGNTNRPDIGNNMDDMDGIGEALSNRPDTSSVYTRPTGALNHYGVWLEEDHLRIWTDIPDNNMQYQHDDDVSFTGNATYSGPAGGYASYSDSDGETVGKFTANVEIEARFGTATEMDVAPGTIRNFKFEDKSKGPLPFGDTNISSDWVDARGGFRVSGGGLTGRADWTAYSSDGTGDPEGIVGWFDLTYNNGDGNNPITGEAVGVFDATK